MINKVNMGKLGKRNQRVNQWERQTMKSMSNFDIVLVYYPDNGALE